MITQEELKELMEYNPDSGLFVRIKKTNNKQKIGEIVGSLQKTGYIHIKIKGKIYQCHRLAWLYMYGYSPKDQLDHINQIKSDNRIENLREVSNSTNGKNQSKSILNKSGVTGVHFDNQSHRWKSQIVVDGKLVFLGRFEVFSDAVDARKNAEELYGFHENHGKDKTC